MATPDRKRRYEERNREKRRSKKAADYKANQKEARASSRARYWAKRDECSAKKKIYYLKRRDDLIAAAKAWNAANPEAKRRNNERWAEKHPEQTRMRVRARSERVRNALGSHTAEEIAQLLIKQQFRCANPDCRASLAARRSKDHIQPLSKGGSNAIENIQMLCLPCNQRKGAKVK